MLTHPIMSVLAIVAIAFVISIATPLHLAAGIAAVIAPVVIALAGNRRDRLAAARA